jgi:hypothetical protein
VASPFVGYCHQTIIVPRKRNIRRRRMAAHLHSEARSHFEKKYWLITDRIVVQKAISATA